MNLRALVYLVVCDSGWVSLEHLLLSRHPSKRGPASVRSLDARASSQPTLDLSTGLQGCEHLPLLAHLPTVTSWVTYSHIWGYRGTSLTRKCTPLGPYRRPVTRVLGGGVVLWTRYPCSEGARVRGATMHRERRCGLAEACSTKQAGVGLQGYLIYKKMHPPRSLP